MPFYSSFSTRCTCPVLQLLIYVFADYHTELTKTLFLGSSFLLTYILFTFTWGLGTNTPNYSLLVFFAYNCFTFFLDGTLFFITREFSVGETSCRLCPWTPKAWSSFTCTGFSSIERLTLYVCIRSCCCNTHLFRGMSGYSLGNLQWPIRALNIKSRS